MNITLEIPNERIAQLMCSAIEGGDPVTTASRGGWCAGIYWKSAKDTPPQFKDRDGKDEGPWYAVARFYVRPFRIEIVEVVNETTGRKKNHYATPQTVRMGLIAMASLYPDQFAQIMVDNIDAPCADAFLQSMLFGKEKYA